MLTGQGYRYMEVDWMLWNVESHDVTAAAR
jgi:hypothetical protein